MDDEIEGEVLPSNPPSKKRGTFADSTTNDLLRSNTGNRVSGFLARFRSLGERSVDEARAMQADARVKALDAWVRLTKSAKRAYVAEAELQVFQENLDEFQQDIRTRVKKQHESSHKKSMADLQRELDRSEAELDPELADGLKKAARLEIEQEIRERTKAAEEPAPPPPPGDMSNKYLDDDLRRLEKFKKGHEHIDKHYPEDEKENAHLRLEEDQGHEFRLSRHNRLNREDDDSAS